MSTDRWQRLQDLFHGAVVLPPAEREGFLAAACADDPELRRQIDRLLAAHDRPEGIIEKAIGSDELWPEEDEASAVGRRFGAYRAVRELGRGGMGSVYLGERADGQFEQLVAIKAIKRGMDTAQLLQRFRAER